MNQSPPAALWSGVGSLNLVFRADSEAGQSCEGSAN
jgi:hypothetical protein